MDPGRRRCSFASKRSTVRTAFRVVGGGGTADGRSLRRRVAIHHCGAEWRSGKFKPARRRTRRQRKCFTSGKAAVLLMRPKAAASPQLRWRGRGDPLRRGSGQHVGDKERMRGSVAPKQLYLGAASRAIRGIRHGEQLPEQGRHRRSRHGGCEEVGSGRFEPSAMSLQSAARRSRRLRRAGRC